MTLGDRRSTSPLEIVGQATGILDALEPLFVRSLSPEGMLIESPNPLEVGSIHEFRLTRGTTSLRVHAAVRQVSPLHQPSAERYFLVDLEFRDLSPQFRPAVEGWLNATSTPPTRKEP